MPENHTPGPWVWFYRDRLYQDRADSGPMPTVLAARGNSELLVSDADANLIAAAPELLAALEGMLDITDDIHGMEGFTVEDFDARVDAAKAAVAKARGRP